MGFTPKEDNKVSKVVFYDDTTYINGAATTMATYSVDMTSLDDGDGYEVLVFGSFVASTNTKSVRLKIGTQTFSNQITTSSASETYLGWRLEGYVTKVDASNSRIVGHAKRKESRPQLEGSESAGTQVLGNLSITVEKVGSPNNGEIIIEGIIVKTVRK